MEEVDKEVFHLSKKPLNHTIEELLTEVIRENSGTLGKEFVRPEIHWTDRAMASYAFREKERMYKDFQKQEHFLEYVLRDFDGDFDY